jgi:hypothetical protein
MTPSSAAAGDDELRHTREIDEQMLNARTIG